MRHQYAGVLVRGVDQSLSRSRGQVRILRHHREHVDGPVVGLPADHVVERVQRIGARQVGERVLDVGTRGGPRLDVLCVRLAAKQVAVVDHHDDRAQSVIEIRRPPQAPPRRSSTFPSATRVARAATQRELRRATGSSPSADEPARASPSDAAPLGGTQGGGHRTRIRTRGRRGGSPSHELAGTADRRPGRRRPPMYQFPPMSAWTPNEARAPSTNAVGPRVVGGLDDRRRSRCRRRVALARPDTACRGCPPPRHRASEGVRLHCGRGG